jgi:transcriptional regulator with XRE-family HTH domain
MIEGEPIIFEVGVSPLKTLRESLGLSQEKLARALDVSTQTISRCERGETELTFSVGQIKNLLKLLTKAGLSLEQLPDSLSTRWN